MSNNKQMDTKKKKPERQEKEVAGVCVCGRRPCTVKHKSKYLLACPDSMACTMRSRWKSNEQDAIKDWNDAVRSARYERTQKCKN